LRFLAFLAAGFGAAFSAAAAPPPSPPPLEAYGRLPLVAAVAMSPSGQRIAAAVEAKDGKTVVVRDTSGALVAGFTFKISKIRGLQFAGEDRLIIFEVSAPTRYYERGDVMVVDLKTRKSFLVFVGSNQVWNSVYGWRGVREVDGHWYGFAGGISRSTYGSLREGAYFADLYRVDLDTGKPELVSRSEQRPRGWLVGAQGQVLANVVYDLQAKQWTVYAGDGVSRPILQRKGVDTLDIESQGRAPGTIVVSERVNDATSLREVRLDGQGEGKILSEGEAATGALVDLDSHLLIGLSTVRQQQLFDPVLQKRIEIAHDVFPSDRARIVSFSRNFDRMIFNTSGPHNAGRYWLVDAVSRQASPVGDQYPEIAPDQVGPMRLFTYKAADGLPLEGVLTLPPGRASANLPLIVMPHGGPFVAGDQPEFDWWAQAFASRGYAVLQPNYRGSLGYGDAFRRAGEGEFGHKMLSDISDGMTALASAGIADPKRACIVGWSYGGYAALAGVTLQRGQYRCAVSMAGVSDVDQMIYWDRAETSATERYFLLRQWHDMTHVDAGEGASISPRRAADKADAPVLLLHGENDGVVPIEQSKMMRSALAGARKPVEFVSLGSVGHDLDDEKERQKMLAASVAFVEKHNPAN